MLTIWKRTSSVFLDLVNNGPAPVFVFLEVPGKAKALVFSVSRCGE